MRSSGILVAALAAGALLASSLAASACEDAEHAVAPGGGSASALQRAGLMPAGVASMSGSWKRVPLQVGAAAPAATLDARSLRAGVHAAPLELAEKN